MIWQDAALGMAGAIGCFVAVVHGMLIQRYVVMPLQKHAIRDDRIAAPIARLVAPLVQFSTFSWFLGGLGLIVAAIWLGYEARLVIGLFVGSQYLFGALANLWATRGRHPGWMLMVAALVLILVGVNRPDG
jgi:hypothetical protein